MKTKLIWIGIVGMSLVLVACGGKKKDVNYGSKDRGDRGPAVAKPPPPAKQADKRPPAKPAQWVRVARADMPFAAKPNRLNMAAPRGTYSELQFVTSGASVMLMDVQVNFTDGTRWTATLNQRSKKGSNTQVVRLPALSRPVDRLYVTYTTVDGNRATLTVNGR